MSRGIGYTLRQPQAGGARRRTLGRLRHLAGVAITALAVLAPSGTALAAPKRGAAPALSLGREVDPNKQMLLSADQIDYNYDAETVSAVGNVQIYYDKYTLESDRVVYNQKTGRVKAVGNVRMTEPSGNVIRAESLDVTDTMREGLVESLRVQTPDQTRFAAASGERVSEEVTVFRKGVYTACLPCRENPSKPPLWQVKAARIVYDQREKMIYYTDAQLELYGLPVAYFPFFSHPDPTGGRRSGFLQPSVNYSEDLGVGISTPYYFNLAPNYDLTVTPTWYTNQGLLAEAEWRHRLQNGMYTIRGAGILQQDPGAFGLVDDPDGPGQIDSPGNTVSRGYLQSTGEFKINEFWTWGWEAWLMSDRTFVRNYSLVESGTTEVVSKLYLTGLSDRNYFDIRAMKFQTLSASENEDVIPTVHPVMDYSKIFDSPIAGGQLSLDMNFTSLSRDESSWSRGYTRDYYTGLAGTTTRMSTKLEWERNLIDSYGGVYTPFLSARGDAYWFSLDERFVPESMRAEEEFAFRGTPAAGIEYRWPFMSAHDWGTQVIEPIAQLVARPDEQMIGELPNEDAQSLVYDDSNLFSRDKMSGWDRAEGGVRANIGVSYTVTTDSGAYANVMFGQSYHLAGRNSYAADHDEQLGLGTNSGLEDDTGDYVGRVLLQPIESVSLVTRFRLDHETFETERIEAGVQFSKGPITASVIYADLPPQPNLDQHEPRQEVVASGSLKLNDYWSLTGSTRYDIERDETRAASIGLIYADECFSAGISYIGQYYDDEDSEPDNRIMVEFNFRTLGGGSFSQSLDTDPVPASTTQ